MCILQQTPGRRGEPVHRTVEELVGEFYGFPFEPYGPVKTQVFSILGLVNAARRRAGLMPVPKEAVWLKRRYVKPFAHENGTGGNAPHVPAVTA